MCPYLVACEIAYTFSNFLKHLGFRFPIPKYYKIGEIQKYLGTNLPTYFNSIDIS